MYKIPDKQWNHRKIKIYKIAINLKYLTIILNMPDKVDNHQESINRQIRALIVSSSHMIRVGLRMVLELHSNILIVGEVSAAGTALEAATREHPDIVLIDLDLSVIDVLSLIRDLQKAAENVMLLIVSSLFDGDLTRKALCSGAAGVVLKVQPPAVLIAAIESLCSSKQVERKKIRPIPFLHKPHGEAKKIDQDILRVHGLTTREREIIYLIGDGLKNRGIADRLCISETTVRHHLTSIFSKLDVSNRQQLLIWAHRYHLVELTQSPDTA